MRMLALATALLAACGAAAPAIAADMPLKAKAPPRPVASPFWISADYLLWSVKGDKLPALVSTGNLGAPGTAVLFGDAAVNDRWRSGAEIKAGYWFDPQRSWGIEGSGFWLQDASTGFNASSNGTPALERPFLDVTTGLQDTQIVAAPGVSSGQVAINETSRLWGAGAALRREICASCAGRVTALVGYRYLRASDGLTIATSQQGNNLVFGGPFAIAITDQFATANNFSGLDLGLSGETQAGAFTFEWLGKVALGATFSTVQINGATSVALGGGVPTTVAGGLLALSSNIGSFSQTRFAVVPEVALKLGYQVTSQLRVHAGYDFLYWSNVVRPGNVIDTGVNPTLLPPAAPAGPSRPAPRLDGSDFWAQGVNLGAVLSF
jgi:Putative beta barrel porin-7 (BBP7)